MKQLSANILLSLFCLFLFTSSITFGAVAIDNDRENEKLIHPGDRLLNPKPKNFQPTRNNEDTSEFWINAAKTYLNQQLDKKPNKKIAKNVILFMADGMSVATLAAARVNLGGEEKELFFESFPSRGLSKTYCVSNQVADSSSTSTAYLCGVKTNYGVVGLNAQVPRYNCTAQLDESTLTPSIAKWAQDAGKSAGFVTTTRITDASPAGVYSHAANRYWENNQKVLNDKCDPTKIKDLAHQLVYGNVGRNLKVILGGGRREFRDTKMADEENHSNYRTDGRDLIQEWKDSKIGTNSSYVWHAKDLRTINPNETEYLLGMFEGTHMMYHLDTLAAGATDSEPTLMEMVDKAIDILNRNENGFFLFVEGGRVDHGHHGTRSRLAVDETTEYAKAIELAKNKLGDDTLIVVTADHSHTMTYGGYDVSLLIILPCETIFFFF